MGSGNPCPVSPLKSWEVPSTAEERRKPKSSNGTALEGTVQSSARLQSKGFCSRELPRGAVLVPRTHLQDPEGALVTHADKAAQGELQHHGALEGHEVPDVLQQEEPRPVVVAVAARRERDHERGWSSGRGSRGRACTPPPPYLRKETTREFLNLE